MERKMIKLRTFKNDAKFIKTCENFLKAKSPAINSEENENGWSCNARYIFILVKCVERKKHV